MHDTAMMYGKLFFQTYSVDTADLVIVDIGSQDVNGSLRSVAPRASSYIGIDFTKGKGVGIILSDPYTFPLKSESADIIVSSSCFEHSEFFWLVFNEMLRVLKPSGLIYINAPSNGEYHRYPVDCWRFYTDGGIALQNWGNRSGYDCALLESFIGIKSKDFWHDFVAVFVKNLNHVLKYPNRIQDNTPDFTNGRLLNSEHVVNCQPLLLRSRIKLQRQRIERPIKSIVKKNIGRT